MKRIHIKAEIRDTYYRGHGVDGYVSINRGRVVRQYRCTFSSYMRMIRIMDKCQCVSAQAQVFWWLM